jgi:hypothetical protein
VIFPTTDRDGWLLTLPLILCSDYYLRLINAQTKFGSFEVGAIKQLPRPQNDWLRLTEDAKSIYAMIDVIDQQIENTAHFVAPGQRISIASIWRDILAKVTDGLETILKLYMATTHCG